MRKKTFIFAGGFFIFCYVIAITYLFLHRPLSKNIKYNDITIQIERLENELRRQLKENSELINRLRSIRDEIQNTSSVLDHSDEINEPVIAVLLFSCNRLTVKRSLDQLLKYRPSERRFPIVVSQDCDHLATRRVLERYGSTIKYLRHPDQSDIRLTGREKKFKGYYKISRHYRWALNQIFNNYKYQTVIIVEDDLDVSPDFYEYFSALYPILNKDASLWCISAWNDNGKDGLVANDPALLRRTDFFPGLGWMLTKKIWNELEVKWPKAYWDDWIRHPNQRKGRACIAPEMSRTKTFGKIGVSNGLFFEKHLKFIKLNDKFVPFTKFNLTYLLKENYDVSFLKEVYGSPAVDIKDLISDSVSESTSVRLMYTNRESFKKQAKTLGLMDDFKSGVPRTGYLGIVSFFFRGRTVYLAPSPEWKGYNTSWT